MEPDTQTSKPAKRVKAVLFTIFGVLIVLYYLIFIEALTEGLLPWVTIGCPACDATNPNYNLELYRWFGAQHGALVGILYSGSLIALLWKPRNNPLLLQFFIIGFILFSATFFFFSLGDSDLLNLAFQIFCFFIVPLIILALTYPGKGLWSNIFKQAEYHWSILLLTLVAFVLLIPQTWQHATLQLNSDHEFATYFRYAGSVNLFLGLISSGIVAATRKPGWKQLTILIGITYIYLGIAAITIPDQPESWGTYWGILSIIGGIAYLACTKDKKRKQTEI